MFILNTFVTPCKNIDILTVSGCLKVIFFIFSGSLKYDCLHCYGLFSFAINALFTYH
ncbi:MAG: hypothetical protein IJ143_06245 [Neisseriaceae bacterium]|nr:hypothetical protein [Neisseriaceae bacterium]